MQDQIGVLALQGAVEPHLHKLELLGISACVVRNAETLQTCAGLILPGGESTTMLLLLEHQQLLQPLQAFAQSKPIWGVCAGAILLAREVRDPTQPALGIMPITVRRNAYGRQNESFIAPIAIAGAEPPLTAEGVFIRAPQIVDCDSQVRVLATHGEQVVAIQYQQHLATTFHPELSNSDWFHRHFMTLCALG